MNSFQSHYFPYSFYHKNQTNGQMTEHTGNSSINSFNKYDCTPTMCWRLGCLLIIIGGKKDPNTLERDSLGEVTGILMSKISKKSS